MLTERTELRNHPIIAHVGHGKTRLVDGMLKQARVFRDNQPVAERVMDSYDLERERGITILAKDLDLRPADRRPGEDQHRRDADFGGEARKPAPASFTGCFTDTGPWPAVRSAG